MIENMIYSTYKGNEDSIEEFFDALFFFRDKKKMSILKGYLQLKGNAINDYMSCHFAAEFPDRQDEEYFGESGVVFYLDYPAVPKDCIIVLTYDEFFQVVKKHYEKHTNYTPKERTEVTALLSELEKKLQQSVKK